MTPEEELAHKIRVAVMIATTNLEVNNKTLTRALADEHRRVDEAIAVRQQTEIDRNVVAGRLDSVQKENTGLQRQVEHLHTDLGAAQRFHTDVLGHLAKFKIATPQEGYLKSRTGRVTNDLDILRETAAVEALAFKAKQDAEKKQP